jgi:hypothetical protein
LELTELLNAGGIAGLIGNALNGVCGVLFARLRPINAVSRQSLEQRIAMLVAHLAVGVALGFVYWLSWGFTAIVGVAWWQRGIIFALATWTLCCVPLVSAQLLTLRIPRSVTATIATQWLTTFVLAGLACAWHWGHRS